MSDIDNDPKKPRDATDVPASEVRPDDDGRIQYEDEVKKEDAQDRPSNPNNLSPREDKGRRLENPLLDSVDE